MSYVFLIWLQYSIRFIRLTYVCDLAISLFVTIALK